MKETLPLTVIQNAVIDFVRGRDDVVLCPVSDCLQTAQVDQSLLDLWRELVAEDLLPESEDDDF